MCSVVLFGCSVPLSPQVHDGKSKASPAHECRVLERPAMTRETRQTLVTMTRRFGISGTLLIGAMSWGFRTYDATNASATAFRAYRDSVAYRRTLDSLQNVYQFQYLRGSLARTDSNVRKICAAVRAGC